MNRRIAVLALAVLTACAQKDKTPPPAPHVDATPSPTQLAIAHVTGSAEYNAKIHVTRKSPALGAGEKMPADLAADPFTARFELDLPLALTGDSTDNVFDFTATDAAGNVSQATEVKITRVKNLGYQLLLTDGSAAPAASLTVAAGAQVIATVVDPAGNPVDAPITLSTTAPGALVVGNTLSNLTAAGTWAVMALVANQPAQYGFAVAAAASLTVKPGPVTALSLTLSSASAVAGEHVPVTVTATDAYGNVVVDPGMTFSSTPALPATFAPPCASTSASDQGFFEGKFTAYDLSGVQNAGYLFTLTATDGTLTADATLVVRPAAAARFGDSDPANGKCGDLFAIDAPGSTTAGGSIGYHYAVVDTYGNATVGPVRTFTTAPNAQIADDGISGVGTISNLTVAGTYNLSGYISGVGSPVVQSFSVGVANPATLQFFLNTSLASRSDTIRSFGVVRDTWSNLIACDPTTLSLYSIAVSPAGTNTAGAVSCTSSGAFEQDFQFSADNSYSLTATYSATSGAVSASAFVTILGIDATPPTVTIENVAVNGQPCAPAVSPPTCAAAPGDTIDFDAVATDNVSLSEVDYSIFFQTTGNGRARQVYIGAGTTSATIHFTFNVPGGALNETAPLVARAVDGAGNIATSVPTGIAVNPVLGGGGRTVTVIANGSPLQGPMDVALDGSLNIYVANDGAANLLEIAAGSKNPVAYSNYNGRSGYLTRDSVGDLYVTDRNSGTIWQVPPAGNVVSYVNLNSGGGGRVARGLDLTAATSAKGLVDWSAGNDGDTVTIGSVVYELDRLGNGCATAGATCVAVAAGQNANDLLAQAVNGTLAGSTAHPTVAATFNNGTCGATSASCAVLAAKTPGEGAGQNAIALGTSNGTLIHTSGTTLRQGHGEEFWNGQDAAGDTNIYRWPENLTPTAPLSQNHGAYNVTLQQRGIALRDLDSAAAPVIRDLVFYFADPGQQNLYGYHYTEDLGGAPAQASQLFNVGNGPTGGFGQLYDVAVEPGTGCLLVSDAGNGEIYAFDTRTVTNAAPAGQLVARGFNDPRGIAFGADGNLYVADRGFNAIFKITAAGQGGCF